MLIRQNTPYSVKVQVLGDDCQVLRTVILQPGQQWKLPDGDDKLEWTHDFPLRSGYYWLSERGMPTLVYYIGNREFFVVGPEPRMWKGAEEAETCWWLGPLHEPVPPAVPS